MGGEETDALAKEVEGATNYNGEEIESPAQEQRRVKNEEHAALGQDYSYGKVQTWQRLHPK